MRSCRCGTSKKRMEEQRMVQKLSLPSLPKKAVPMPWERKAIYTVETEDGDLMAMGPEELRNYANSQRAGASSDYTKTSEEIAQEQAANAARKTER